MIDEEWLTVLVWLWDPFAVFASWARTEQVAQHSTRGTRWELKKNKKSEGKGTGGQARETFLSLEPTGRVRVIQAGP